MKLRIYTFAIILFAGSFTAHAQNNVGINTNMPDASAALDISSTSQGVLVPRMTASQRALIASPATAYWCTKPITPLAFIFSMARCGRA